MKTKCQECSYNDNGSCLAATMNRNKYTACLKSISDLPNAAQTRDAELSKEQERIDNGFCPKCAQWLRESEGCRVCLSCGWSACDN